MEAKLRTPVRRPAPPAPVRRPVPPRRAALQELAAAAFLRAETLFVILALFLFSQALVPLLLESGSVGDGSDGYESNMTLRLMFASLHAGSLFLVLVHWRAGFAAAARHWPAVALVGLALASTYWSSAPDITLRRSFAFLGTTAFGVLLAARYDTRTLLLRVAAALGTAAVLSVVFAVALPAYGVDQLVHAGAWQGIYTEKNTLGQMMALSTVVFLILRPTLRRRWIGTAGALLSVALVLLSTSKSALVILLVFGVLAALFRTLRLSYTLAVPIAIGFVLAGGSVAVWLATNVESALLAMGKDPTLTGRTEMWATLIRSVAERPWMGYGYSAFWLGWQGPSAKALAEIGWETPGAHNGYLDLGLQLGVVGIAVFAAGFAFALARSFAAVRETRTPEGFWPGLYLAFMLVYNFTETMLATPNNIFWALYVATVCSALLQRGGEGRVAA